MNKLSENFELRYISSDPSANGETDFKGETSTLSTEDRISFLNEYARRMKDFYEDVSLDKEIVTLDAARSRLAKIKPQPQPEIRKRIHLKEWKWIGFSENKKPHKTVKQDFRCFIEWELSHTVKGSELRFGKAALMGFDTDGSAYYISDGKEYKLVTANDIKKIRFELDFVYRKWNIYINDMLAADFVSFSDTTVNEAEEFTDKGSNIIHIWGVGYHRTTEDAFEPFSINTFIDKDFVKEPARDISGWNTLNFCDGEWNIADLPITHGGERYEGEDLYLRNEFEIDGIPPYAELYLESLTPGGEVYINGRLAAFIEDECCHKIDILKYLRDGKNLIAVRVYADKVTDDTKMTHTPTDHSTGWFAGRMHIDLLPPIYIDDVFSYTKNIGKASAEQVVEVSVKTKRGLTSKLVEPYTVSARIMPWYPEDGKVAAEAKWQTRTAPNLTEATSGILKINAPLLWTAEAPNLYKIVVEIRNTVGEVKDDYVITTGIRTVSQDGGIFRINGKPEMLRAPLLFGERPPLDKIAAWQKCPPAEFYVQEILMLKGMNGNGFRMSVHDKRMGGMNDARLCEICDQMGVMLIWQTTTWLRITSATNINYNELEACIKQVRNAPSIVIWQPLNHPSWKDWDITMKVYRMLYESVTKLDRTRLISPAADVRRMRARYDDGLTDFWGNPCDECDPIWTAPLFCRGNMDYILGYGNTWSALREWPDVKEEHLPNWAESTGYVRSYLDSKERAYFNFEHDEIIGQPNWDLYKGKPMYKIKSYEVDYDEGSIGRELDFGEWLESQAWQALGAYETIKKCRMLDYDGLCWCNLRGGQNTVTYMKNIVDFYGQAKLGYYAHRMAFQDVIACSGNADMVYGPEDTVPVIVMNIGDAKTVNVSVQVISQNNDIVFETVISDVELAEGRTVTKAADIKLPNTADGLYMIRYTLLG
ncbi:MAG: hypothetical protein IJH37_10055 [Clostridia bacterium]|nr:hypothetical protein [Clostridia bacterium]